MGKPTLCQTYLHHSTSTNMSDALRESTGDKLARNVQPEGTKSTGQKVEDTARDAYESVAGSVQPNSEKGVGQSVSDTLGGNDKTQGDSLAKQAMDAVGLDGNKAALPQLQQAATDAINAVTGSNNNPPK